MNAWQMLERSTCGLLHMPTDMAPWHTIAASMGITVSLGPES